MKFTINLFRITLISVMLFLAFSYKASAQRDLLITQAGEEIRCRILDETPTRFIYAYIGKGDKVLRNEIFKNLVTSFKYNYYDTDIVKASLLPGDSKSGNSGVKRVDTRKTQSREKRTSKKQRAKNSNELEAQKSETISSGRSVPTNNTVEEKGKDVQKDKVRISENLSNSNVAQNDKESVATIEQKLEKVELDGKGIETDIESSIDKLSKKQKRELDKEAKKLAKNEKKIASESEVKLENEELLKEEVAVNEYKNYLKFRIGVKGGISNIINNALETNNAYDLYREKLNKGWTFGADAAYFITEGFGIGAMFTNYMTSHSAEGLTYPNLLTETIIDNGSIDTQISNKYVGPVLYFRKGIDFKTFVVLGISPGMNFYKETGNYNGENFEFNTKQFGGAATLGLDFLLGNDLIGRDIILSLEAGYNYARFNDMNYGGTRGNVTFDNPLVMDRLDFSIGLRFLRFPRYLKLN
jgi:hypothetical protein